MAYADGDASAHVVEHVRRCPQCAEEARSLASAQRRLRHLLYRFDCPSPQLLGEYELDLLSPEARTQTAAHVRDCPRCAEELQALRSFMSLEPMTLEPVRPLGVGARLRHVVATLLVPPSAAAYAGLRGTAEAGVRTYRAEGLTITLGPGPDARRGRASIMGLVVPEDAGVEAVSGGEARLVAPGGGAHATPIDELGNFAFEDLTPGPYRLELHLADQVFLVEDLPVGS